MSAHLDNTLVWIAFDNSCVLMIFLMIDMVQLSSAWLLQQCTFFICSFSVINLIDFCSLYGGAWRAVPFEYILIRPISSFLRPGFVLLHTSTWRLVPQTFGKDLNLDFLSIVILSLCRGHLCYNIRHRPSSFNHAHGWVYIALISTLLQGINMAMAVYTYSITDWGNPEQLQMIVW